MAFVFAVYIFGSFALFFREAVVALGDFVVVVLTGVRFRRFCVKGLLREFSVWYWAISLCLGSMALSSRGTIAWNIAM